MTWHPNEQPSTEPKSPNSPDETLAAKRARFKRANTEFPSSRQAGEPVVKIKLGTVTRERHLSFSTKTSTPSPTRYKCYRSIQSVQQLIIIGLTILDRNRRQGVNWNFPLQLQPNNRQGRFVISRADSRVEDVFNSRRSRRGSKKENTSHLYDIHDLVP